MKFKSSELRELLNTVEIYILKAFYNIDLLLDLMVPSSYWNIILDL